jgi:hypothetical protein
MNAGSNPRNLHWFYDWHDYDRYGLVNYADYVGATVSTGNTAVMSFLDEEGTPLRWVTADADTLYMQVLDADGGTSGADSMQVLLESSSDSLGMVTLYEEGNSGVFSGSVALSHGTFRVYEGTEEAYNSQVEYEFVAIDFQLDYCMPLPFLHIRGTYHDLMQQIPKIHQNFLLHIR